MTVRKPARSGGDEARLRDIMRSLRGLVAVLSQSARTVEQTTGVTNAQLFVLQHLAEHGARSINDIATAALTQQSAVSLIVTRLERERLVSRTRSVEDARRVDVALTPAGRRLLKSAPPPPTTRLLDALRRLPAAKQRALGDGLTSLVSLLGSDDGDEPMMLFEAAPRRSRAPRAGGT